MIPTNHPKSQPRTRHTRIQPPDYLRFRSFHSSLKSCKLAKRPALRNSPGDQQSAASGAASRAPSPRACARAGRGPPLLGRACVCAAPQRRRPRGTCVAPPPRLYCRTCAVPPSGGYTARVTPSCCRFSFRCVWRLCVLCVLARVCGPLGHDRERRRDVHTICVCACAAVGLSGRAWCVRGWLIQRARASSHLIHISFLRIEVGRVPGRRRPRPRRASADR